MPLTPEEEKKIRDEIRKRLEEREKKDSEQKQDVDKARQEQLEARLKAKIKEEEEEKFYSERGLVKYINRHGEREWITPEEVERRKKTRNKRRPSTSRRHKMRKVRNIVINGGLVLIILIVVAVLYKYNPGGGKKAGTVSIQSNISGATIFMNGNKLKRFAPDTLSNVSLGSHYITLFKEGYNTYPPMQVVHVKNKKTSEVSFSLKSAPKLAPVKIKVNIPDFNLYIDGLKTPLKKGSLVEVPIGYHNFMVVKKGYISKPTYQRQLISQSDTVELRFNLTADPELAYLQVSNNLFEGYVYLDNQFTGMQAIGDVMPVKAGSYEVRIRKNGYRCVPDSQFVHVSPGEERLIVFRLKKISRSQPFRIRTQEPGAAIFIDGEFFPFVTPVDELMLSPGLHFLNLARNSKQLSKLDKPFKTNSQQENNLYFRF